MRRLLLLLLFTPLACLAQSGNTVTITGSGAPTGACAYIFQYIDSATGNQYNCLTGAWHQIGGGAATSVPFSGVTASTNTTAAMIVGTGASLAVSGSGTIAATSVTPTACSTVTYSATPTFSGASSTNCFIITLTGDVTSSTFSNGVSGQIYTFKVIQDSTGGRAFVPPTQMKQYGTWMATASNFSIQMFQYDGTNLNAIAPWTPDTRPVTANALDDEFDGNVLSASWTKFNAGTSTYTEKNGTLSLSPQANFGLSGAIQTAPATPWTVTAEVSYFCGTASVNCRGGLVLSDATKYVSFGLSTQSSGIEITRWSDVNTFSAFSLQVNQLTYTNLYVCERVQDDGTNLVYSWSPDCVNFTQVFSQGRTAFFGSGPTQVGFYAHSPSASTVAAATLNWFRRTQ